VVPSEAAASGSCRGCGAWYSLRDLAERALGGKWNAPSGLCPSCIEGEEGVVRMFSV
jgi:hypothetical protein